jgi:hypothetical protein
MDDLNLTIKDLSKFVRGLRDISDGADLILKGMENCDGVSAKAGRPVRYSTISKLLRQIRDEANQAATEGAEEIKAMIAELN